MSTLVFATRNQGKVRELRALLHNVRGSDNASTIHILTLDELAAQGLATPEVIEDGATFAANAAKKALAICAATGMPALADDSGLEVDALAGAPGVWSARYAGPAADDAANNAKLLAALADVAPPARGARFRCVLALALPGHAHVHLTDGVCEGAIALAPRGDHGFGYDPLFVLAGTTHTFAELDHATKAQHSHRAMAMRAMAPLVQTHLGVD